MLLCVIDCYNHTAKLNYKAVRLPLYGITPYQCANGIAQFEHFFSYLLDKKPDNISKNFARYTLPKLIATKDILIFFAIYTERLTLLVAF
jgi:hypothetical protein